MSPTWTGRCGATPWLTYDLFQDNIIRPVPLGIFTDQNNANTTGQSLALALRGGCDVGVGRFTTGPVAGLVLQQVRVDGFTETGASGVTALSFDSQTRDSFVSQLGWRVLADLGRLQPFAEMNWNHECADQRPHGNDLAHLGGGPVLHHGRRPGGLRLGHRIARRILPTQPAGDAARRGFGHVHQSADGQPSAASWA